MPPPQESPAPVPTPAPDEATSAKPATPTAGASSKGDTEQLRQAIRIRELKTQVLLNDPAIEAQKKMAACAKTEEGRRILTRNYYTLLYTAMEKLDPSLTAVLETQLYNILLGYEQSKVRPSELIEDVVALPGSHSADHAPAATTATAMKNSAPQTSSAEKTPKPKKFDR